MGSVIAGGNFWRGAQQGAIVAVYNHAVHSIANGGKKTSSQQQDPIKQKRKLLKQNALKYKDSKKWSFSTSKDNFASGTNKCNKFVYDVLNESGIDVPLPNGNPIKRFFGFGSPITAEQWADPDYNISGFTIVDTPQAGDIVAARANFSDATGHVGIMISPTQSIGAGYYSVKTSNFGSGKYDLSSYPGNNGYIYRRYTGQQNQ